MLDFIIDKNIKIPIKGMEYIYRMNMVWKPEIRLQSFPIKINTIVINVVRKENGGFEFTNKETGERLCTNYAWALAENTVENIIRIQEYDKEIILFEAYEKKVNKLRDNIITLHNGNC